MKRIRKIRIIDLWVGRLSPNTN